MESYKKQQEYIIGDRIGRGGFSEVYSAIHKATGVNVAIKAVAKEKVPADIFDRELKLLKMLDHPFCIAFYEDFEDRNFWYIVMEKVECGTLLSEINKNNGISENRSRHVFCQLISTLDYLHKDLRIAHRDVKAENIMFDRNENIRLIDFGLSNIYRKDDPLLKTACGSPAYAPPEMLTGRPYDEKADVWSSGVVLFAMMTGTLPFHDLNIQKLVQKIVYTEPIYPDSMPREVKDLIGNLLIKDPKGRLSLKEISENPWFKKYPRCHLMDSSFGLDQGWKNLVEGKFAVDQKIIAEMQRRNIPVDTVVNDLENGIQSLQSTSYKILKREATIDSMEPYVDCPEISVIARKRNISSIPRPVLFPKKYHTIFSPYTRPPSRVTIGRKRSASNGEVVINEIGVAQLREEYLSKAKKHSPTPLPSLNKPHKRVESL